MMNERIENLITKSGGKRRLIMGMRHETFFTDEQIEQFANLIIADCIEIVEPCKCGCNDGDKQVEITLRLTANIIREHFGVK
jgi:hypothetical protein